MDDAQSLLLTLSNDWPAAAGRRIAQLETALARRHEQLDDVQAALAAVHASHAYKLAQLLSKIANKALPLHSRRRRSARALMGSIVRAVRRATGRNLADVGEGGESVVVALDQVQYARWIEKYERGATAKPQAAGGVKISVVVPVYRTPERFLREMIASVRGQTFGNWELCLAVVGEGGRESGIGSRESGIGIWESGIGGMPIAWDRHGRDCKDENMPLQSQSHGTQQPSIRAVRLTENLGIAGNTNAALALATGEFVAFLDHDDVLAPHALAEVAAAIQKHPDADVIYSDEDKLDEAGRRVDPCFKPGWSPDLLRTHNYLCHLVAVRRTLVQELGGIRMGFDGAQDYDFVLRATERARRIVHIPKVLYHWRLHQQSTAQNTDSKQYLVEAGRRALAEHLERMQTPAKVTPGAKPGEYRVTYQLPRQPLVSVLIPNRDQAQLLGRCLESLAQSSYANYEVLILENGSTQEDTGVYYEQLSRKRQARVLNWTRPFNFAAINNFGAVHARGEVLLFLNNDVEALHPDWMEALVTHALRPEIGAVGAKLLFADGSVQHAGVVLGMGGVAGHVHSRFPRDAAGYLDRLRRVQNVAAVTGACLMTRREVFEQVGGFDERFVLAYNDVDYGMQVRALGYRVLWTPEAELYHLESKTRGYEDDPVKQARFRREFDLFRNKWAAELAAGDPYYSPNLRLDRGDAALRA